MLKRLSVPGNLLLLGEYAVLENSGLGLALAPDLRVQLEIDPDEAFGLTGIWGGKQVDWRPHEEGQPLFSALWQVCSARLQRFGIDAADLQGRIRVDSSALYHANGRKGGFGSSAAVSVAVAAAVMLQAGLSADDARREAEQAALEGHRLAQGGQGSGYDVYTSSHGSIGLFSGGSQPGWTSLCLDWLPPLYLFAGPGSVSSGASVSKYSHWKNEHPEAAARFLKESNAAVSGFAESRSWDQARPHFENGRDVAIRLGRTIGVPAEIVPPAEIEDCLYKAVGAGDELGVALGGAGTGLGESETFPLRIAKGGILWNQ